MVKGYPRRSKPEPLSFIRSMSVGRSKLIRMERLFAERLDWAARFDALVDELDVEPGVETRFEPGTSTLLRRRGCRGRIAVPGSAALDALTRRLLDAESAQFAANRALAAQLAAVHDVLDLARRTPLLYLQPAAVAASDAAELAVRAAAEELAMRLQLSASTVRNQAHEAEVLQHHLPRIWERFASGAASYVDARSAVEQVCGLTDDREAIASLDRRAREPDRHDAARQIPRSRSGPARSPRA